MKTNQICRWWLPLLLIAMITVAMSTVWQSVAAQETTQEDSTAPPARESEHGYLGVTLQDLGDNARQEMNYKDQGVLVEGVMEGSPAEKAGLKEDDIIYSFNGHDVDGERSLRDLIVQTKPGDKVDIKIFRNGTKKDIIATIGSSRQGLGSALGRLDSPLRRMLMMEMPDENSVWLGIEVQPLSDQLKDYFQVKGDHGVLVSSVEDNSPAQKAGLKAGDVILRIEDQDISSRSDIQAALHKKEKGDTVTIELIRGGRYKTLKAQVAQMPGEYRSRMPMMRGPERDLEIMPPRIKVKEKIYEKEMSDSLLQERKGLEYDLQMKGMEQALQGLQQEIDELQKDLSRYRNQAE